MKKVRIDWVPNSLLERLTEMGLTPFPLIYTAVVRLEWVHAVAAYDRWAEEARLLEAELTRTALSFKATASMWAERAEGGPAQSCHPIVRAGYQAYMRRQNNVYEGLADLCVGMRQTTESKAGRRYHLSGEYARAPRKFSIATS